MSIDKERRYGNVNPCRMTNRDVNRERQKMEMPTRRRMTCREYACESMLMYDKLNHNGILVAYEVVKNTGDSDSNNMNRKHGDMSWN